MNKAILGNVVRCTVHVGCAVPTLEVLAIITLLFRAVVMFGWVGCGAQSPAFVPELATHMSLVNALIAPGIFCLPAVLVGWGLRRWEVTRIGRGWLMLYTVSAAGFAGILWRDAFGILSWMWG